MTAEDTPIRPGEFLLRVVRLERFRTDKLPLISPNAFEPRGRKSREPDWAGISLYRLDCLASAADVLRDIPADRQPACGVAAVRVIDLEPAGLTVRSDPRRTTVADPNPLPGHVVVPELCTAAFEADPAAIREKMLRLAELASADVRHWPESFRYPTSHG